MKRIFAFIVLAVFTLGIIPARAADAATGVFALASYIPADFSFYAGVRIDDEAVATLDSLIARAYGVAFDLGMTPTDTPTVSDLLSGSAFDDPAETEAILAWLGDYAAFGVAETRQDTFAPGLSMTAILLDDRAAAEAYFLNHDYVEAESQGAWTLLKGDSTLLLNDEVLISVNDATADELSAIFSGDYPRMSNAETFSGAVATLPLDDYGFVVYASPAATTSATFGDMSFDEGLVVGGTMVEGDTLLIDVSLPASGLTAYAPLDQEFARYIPANSTAVIHSSNLSALIESAIAFDRTPEEAARNRQEIARAFSTTGLNLDSLLAWTTGDFAVFASIDMEALVKLSLGQSSDFSQFTDSYEMGFVIETTDRDAAERLMRTIASFMRIVPAGQTGGSVTVTDEQIAGFDATVISISGALPTGEMSVKIAMAVTDDVFVFGTYDAVAASLMRDPGFGSSALAADASPYILPEASSLWLIDGENLTLFGAIPLFAFMGPSVSNVFGSINGSMMEAATLVPSTPVPSPTLAPYPLNTPEMLDAMIARLSTVFRHATISARTLENGMVIRVTLTLGE